jgi:hypothetical protein
VVVAVVSAFAPGLPSTCSPRAVAGHRAAARPVSLASPNSACLQVGAFAPRLYGYLRLCPWPLHTPGSKYHDERTQAAGRFGPADRTFAQRVDAHRPGSTNSSRRRSAAGRARNWREHLPALRRLRLRRHSGMHRMRRSRPCHRHHRRGLRPSGVIAAPTQHGCATSAPIPRNFSCRAAALPCWRGLRRANCLGCPTALRRCHPGEAHRVPGTEMAPADVRPHGFLALAIGLRQLPHGLLRGQLARARGVVALAIVHRTLFAAIGTPGRRT